MVYVGGGFDRSNVMSIQIPDTKGLVASLMGTVCPACGKTKRTKMSVCYTCYCALPATTKQIRYRRIGHGYETAIASALEHLKAGEFHLPKNKENSNG